MESSRILYVEDNDDDFDLLSLVFKKLKHLGALERAYDAASAKSVLKRCAENGNLPELILVDLHLGEDSGKDLIEFIRTQQKYREIPLVAVSGSYIFKDLDEAYKTGANLFMIKPTDLRGWTELAMKLQEYFSPK